MAIISISDSQVNSADQILVADASSKIPAKDGSQITILNATNVASGTIASARLDTGTTANKLVLLDGSGNLPAVNASLLTGIVSATISASDPTISTNPSGGVGTEWNNSTSGEMYICTDATAGANVWTNVGAGSGDVSPFSYQGSSYGYSAGGWSGSGLVTIDKTSFTSDGNSVDAGDLHTGIKVPAGSADGSYGWLAGGYVPSYTNVIQKFNMLTDANATDVADILFSMLAPSGCNNQDYGYAVGGVASGVPGVSNIIQRWAFAASANSVDVGNLTLGQRSLGSNSSATHGFACGGENDGPSVGLCTNIGKFSFASGSEDAAAHGDLNTSRSANAGCSSASYGFQCGGGNGAGGPTLNQIDRFAYASNTTATDWADLTVAQQESGSSSSTTHGYILGGTGGNEVQKFPYASQTNSSDVGDLTVNRHGASQNVHY